MHTNAKMQLSCIKQAGLLPRLQKVQTYLALGVPPYATWIASWMLCSMLVNPCFTGFRFC